MKKKNLKKQWQVTRGIESESASAFNKNSSIDILQNRNLCLEKIVKTGGKKCFYLWGKFLQTDVCNDFLLAWDSKEKKRNYSGLNFIDGWALNNCESFWHVELDFNHWNCFT